MEFSRTATSVIANSNTRLSAEDANKLREIAKSLIDTVDSFYEKPRTFLVSVAVSNCPNQDVDLDYEIYSWIKGEYQERQLRDDFLNQDLFGEAPWDMLLDLYAKAYERKPVSVSSACIASGVPNTTALRWQKVLEEEGLIERKPHIVDGRSHHLTLTPKAVEQLRAYVLKILRK